MDTMYQRCAALDVHKKTITGCVRTPDGHGGRQVQVRNFETFLDALEALRDWLLGCGITIVAMESTGSYWKPVWQVLEDAGLDLVLVNARHVKHVPGRKRPTSRTRSGSRSCSRPGCWPGRLCLPGGNGSCGT